MTYLPESRRQLLAAAQRRAERHWMPAGIRMRVGWVLPALSLALAAAVAVAFLSLRTQPGGGTATAQPRQLELVYRAGPTTEVPLVTHAALERAARQMNLRLSEIPHSDSSIQVLSGDRIRVDVTTQASRARVEALVGSDARLFFYDWETNVLLPNGRTVAQGLSVNDARALELSQGSESVPPGAGGAGALGLYQAVRLAARQPYAPRQEDSRTGSEYYLFSRHGHLASGPLDVGARVSRAGAIRELDAGLSRSQRQGRVLVIKQGTVVVQAAPERFTVAGAFASPSASARYYVLRDRVSVFGGEITHPRAGTDATGAPDVQFGFTGNGRAAFRRLTAAVSRRGELDSSGSQRLFQHFAVALDDQLIQVPQIDYTVYPDGIAGSQADLTGSFSRVSARGLAKALQLSALPVELTLVSARR
ncbi:MAG TPA: hypothetical protein VG405_06250 [Solirubrobacteraceae bacterium]|jgi:preprotein translocase subunit SecD|nr:hypothetical protein [Solirubrobacteraceae bacterium]